jgi:hypothetical protein
VPGSTYTFVYALNDLDQAAGEYIGPSLVPEPSGVVLLGTGLVVLLGYGWHHRRRATPGIG